MNSGNNTKITPFTRGELKKLVKMQEKLINLIKKETISCSSPNEEDDSNNNSSSSHAHSPTADSASQFLSLLGNVGGPENEEKESKEEEGDLPSGEERNEGGDDDSNTLHSSPAPLHPVFTGELIDVFSDGYLNKNNTNNNDCSSSSKRKKNIWSLKQKLFYLSYYSYSPLKCPFCYNYNNIHHHKSSSGSGANNISIAPSVESEIVCANCGYEFGNNQKQKRIVTDLDEFNLSALINANTGRRNYDLTSRVTKAKGSGGGGGGVGSDAEGSESRSSSSGSDSDGGSEASDSGSDDDEDDEDDDDASDAGGSNKNYHKRSESKDFCNKMRSKFIHESNRFFGRIERQIVADTFSAGANSKLNPNDDRLDTNAGGALENDPASIVDDGSVNAKEYYYLCSSSDDDETDIAAVANNKENSDNGNEEATDDNNNNNNNTNNQNDSKVRDWKNLSDKVFFYYFSDPNSDHFAFTLDHSVTSHFCLYFLILKQIDALVLEENVFPELNKDGGGGGSDNSDNENERKDGKKGKDNGGASADENDGGSSRFIFTCNNNNNNNNENNQNNILPNNCEMLSKVLRTAYEIGLLFSNTDNNIKNHFYYNDAVSLFISLYLYRFYFITINNFSLFQRAVYCVFQQQLTIRHKVLSAGGSGPNHPSDLNIDYYGDGSFYYPNNEGKIEFCDVIHYSALIGVDIADFFRGVNYKLKSSRDNNNKSNNKNKNKNNSGCDSSEALSEDEYFSNYCHQTIKKVTTRLYNFYARKVQVANSRLADKASTAHAGREFSAFPKLPKYLRKFDELPEAKAYLLSLKKTFNSNNNAGVDRISPEMTATIVLIEFCRILDENLFELPSLAPKKYQSFADFYEELFPLENTAENEDVVSNLYPYRNNFLPIRDVSKAQAMTRFQSDAYYLGDIDIDSAACNQREAFEKIEQVIASVFLPKKSNYFKCIFELLFELHKSRNSKLSSLKKTHCFFPVFYFSPLANTLLFLCAPLFYMTPLELAGVCMESRILFSCDNNNNGSSSAHSIDEKHGKLKKHIKRLLFYFSQETHYDSGSSRGGCVNYYYYLLPLTRRLTPFSNSFRPIYDMLNSERHKMILLQAMFLLKKYQMNNSMSVNNINAIVTVMRRLCEESARESNQGRGALTYQFNYVLMVKNDKNIVSLVNGGSDPVGKGKEDGEILRFFKEAVDESEKAEGGDNHTNGQLNARTLYQLKETEGIYVCVGVFPEYGIVQYYRVYHTAHKSMKKGNSNNNMSLLFNSYNNTASFITEETVTGAPVVEKGKGTVKKSAQPPPPRRITSEFVFPLSINGRPLFHLHYHRQDDILASSKSCGSGLTLEIEGSEFNTLLRIAQENPNFNNKPLVKALKSKMPFLKYSSLNIRHYEDDSRNYYLKRISLNYNILWRNFLQNHKKTVQLQRILRLKALNSRVETLIYVNYNNNNNLKGNLLTSGKPGRSGNSTPRQQPGTGGGSATVGGGGGGGSGGGGYGGVGNGGSVNSNLFYFFSQKEYETFFRGSSYLSDRNSINSMEVSDDSTTVNDDGLAEVFMKNHRNCLLSTHKEAQFAFDPETLRAETQHRLLLHSLLHIAVGSSVGGGSSSHLNSALNSMLFSLSDERIRSLYSSVVSFAELLDYSFQKAAGKGAMNPTVRILFPAISSTTTTKTTTGEKDEGDGGKLVFDNPADYHAFLTQIASIVAHVNTFNWIEELLHVESKSSSDSDNDDDEEEEETNNRAADGGAGVASRSTGKGRAGGGNENEEDDNDMDDNIMNNNNNTYHHMATPNLKPKKAGTLHANMIRRVSNSVSPLPSNASNSNTNNKPDFPSNFSLQMTPLSSFNLNTAPGAGVFEDDDAFALPPTNTTPNLGANPPPPLSLAAACGAARGAEAQKAAIVDEAAASLLLHKARVLYSYLSMMPTFHTILFLDGAKRKKELKELLPDLTSNNSNNNNNKGGGGGGGRKDGGGKKPSDDDGGIGVRSVSACRESLSNLLWFVQQYKEFKAKLYELMEAKEPLRISPDFLAYHQINLPANGLTEVLLTYRKKGEEGRVREKQAEHGNDNNKNSTSGNIRGSTAVGEKRARGDDECDAPAGGNPPNATVTESAAPKRKGKTARRRRQRRVERRKKQMRKKKANVASSSSSSDDNDDNDNDNNDPDDDDDDVDDSENSEDEMAGHDGSDDDGNGDDGGGDRDEQRASKKRRVES